MDVWETVIRAQSFMWNSTKYIVVQYQNNLNYRDIHEFKKKGVDQNVWTIAFRLDSTPQSILVLICTFKFDLMLLFLCINKCYYTFCLN